METKKKKQDSLNTISVFLYLSVKHRCYDLLRRNTVRVEHQAELVRVLESNADGDFTVEMVKLELIKMIYVEVDKLPEKMKEVFLLTYKEGFKPAEIARRLQLSVQTVKNQRLNATRLLKEMLRDKPLLLALLAFLEY